MTSTETAADAATPAVGAPARAPWHRRVVPVTALVLAVVGLAALLVPGFRHQAALSITHQPQPYVELYFARTADGQAVCARDGGDVRVRFTVASHLPDQADLDWKVLVAGSTSRDADDASGITRLAPGRTTTVDQTFTVEGRDGYLVDVELPELDQHLRARCPGAAS